MTGDVFALQLSGKRILNCVPSRDTEQDWPIEAAPESGFSALKIPESADLRCEWWDVGDQGQTGSCVGWATADGILRWHFYEEGKICAGDHLSARYIWMAAKESDEFRSRPTSFLEGDGTSLKAALDVARKFGVVAEGVLPFAGGLCMDDTVVFYAKAAQMKIAAYYNLKADHNRWLRWLIGRGPILARVEVDDAWYGVKLDGILDAPGSSVYGGHAVCIVGYTPDRFIVRNSWGASWGDKGFAYASEAYARARITEAYGVTL
jgi:hypothetical protein